jgi:uncharacterized LabA/DUF88 family protein
LAGLLVLVDGLNLFHSLRSQDTNKTDLNIASLSETLANNFGVEVGEIIYATALAEHSDKPSRQKQFGYLEKLWTSGVKILTTQFRSQLETCNYCGSNSRKYVEKQTDVAIASNLVAKVLDGGFEHVLLFSADTDFLPAIEIAKSLRPRVEIRIASTPAYLRPVYGLFRKAGVGTIRLSPELVSKHLF